MDVIIIIAKKVFNNSTQRHRDAKIQKKNKGNIVELISACATYI